MVFLTCVIVAIIVTCIQGLLIRGLTCWLDPKRTVGSHKNANSVCE